MYVHEVLVNCLFKLAQEKVWLGELTVTPDRHAMTIAVDLGHKATKQTTTFQISYMDCFHPTLIQIKIQVLSE